MKFIGYTNIMSIKLGTAAVERARSTRIVTTTDTDSVVVPAVVPTCTFCVLRRYTFCPVFSVQQQHSLGLP